MSANNSPPASPTSRSYAARAMLTSMVSIPYTLVNTAYRIYNQLNPVILTGAVDIIVVQQPDGSLKCLPFHVRFGKLAVLHMAHAAHGRLQIDIKINDEPVSDDAVYMMLGENGEAYFHDGGRKCTCREMISAAPATTQQTLPSYMHLSGNQRAESEASRDSGMPEEEAEDFESIDASTSLQFYMDSDEERLIFPSDTLNVNCADEKETKRRKDYLGKRRLSRSTNDLSVLDNNKNRSTSSSPSSTPRESFSANKMLIKSFESFKSVDELQTPAAASVKVADIGSCCKCKTKTLSSEKLSCLNLRPGRNTAEFSVVSRYQGTAVARCHIYLWRYDERIVVSDVDGTITQSDVLGYLMPIVGAQWAQAGITHLYDRIKQNGYRMVYLTSRAVGQSQQTRYYLSRVRQERNTILPDGPLLLWPDSVWSAFRVEIMERRPDRYKTLCLKELRCLFPLDRNPFWAGYGNRITDFVAYQAAGVPAQRIFMVNHLGELWQHTLRHNAATFHAHARDDMLVDALFPAIASACEGDCVATLTREHENHKHHWSRCRCNTRRRNESVDVTYASFNYWNVALTQQIILE